MNRLRDFGAIHQLMDDYVDREEDSTEGVMTFFVYSTIPAELQPLFRAQALTNKLTQLYQMVDDFFTGYANKPDIVNPGLLDQIHLEYTQWFLN